MIPKPLNEIEWSDIEALRDGGREEDDTIEYKASFSGGANFLTFTESERLRAVTGIAAEVVAFLNGRGGDVVIGVREIKNDHPKIDDITPITDVAATADRLAQTLGAVIEPMQSILGVRAILKPGGAGEGVIVIRAPLSLRAPHRYRSNKECYTRRGRESVPMPMDEIQDLTLRRAETLNERVAILTDRFNDLSNSVVGRTALAAHRVHFRTCFVPLARQNLALDNAILAAFSGSDPDLVLGDKRERLDVAFSHLTHTYQPILRGMMKESLETGVRGHDDFIYCSKAIKSDGVMWTGFACRVEIPSRTDSILGFYHQWVVGYFANTIQSMTSVQTHAPWLGAGILRIAIHSAGQMVIQSGASHWSKVTPWPAQFITIPDFEIVDDKALWGFFHQLQRDVADIAGLKNVSIYDRLHSE